MTLLDSIVERSIHQAPDGRSIWYPWSFLGAGYIVPSNQHRTELHRFQKRWTIAAFVLVLVSSLLTASYRLAAFVVFGSLAYAATRRQIDQLERSPIPLSVKAVIQHPNVLPLPLLIVLTFASAVLLVGSALLVITGRDLLTGVMGLALFGWFTCLLTYDIHSQLTRRNAGVV